MSEELLLQCQHLSEQLPSAREILSTLIPGPFRHPPPPPLYIFSPLSPFSSLFCRPHHHILARWEFFFPPFPFHMNHHHAVPTAVSCYLFPSFPSLLLPQTDPVSVGECCMNQQYPAHPSHSLLRSLSLFPLLVIRGHVWLWMLLLLPGPHLSSTTAKNNQVNASLSCEQIWFTPLLCLWINPGSECKRGSARHSEV